MKNLQLLLFILIIIILMQGQSCINGKNYGPMVKESREVSDFEAIEVSHGIDVYLTMGSKEELEVEAPEDLMEELITEVKGGKLRIYFDRTINWNNKTTIHVKAKKIKRISTSGGSDLVGENILKSKNLYLETSGGSDIKLEVDVKKLEANTSGGSDIEISGYAGHVQATSSGGSDLKAFDLTTLVANLEASGGSDIKITVEDELQARASGGADIEYMGNPQKVNINSGTSSDIKKRD